MPGMSSKIPMPSSYAKLLIATQAHLGGTKSTANMSKYVFGQRRDKINVFDIELTWEKMVLAARAFAGINISGSIIAISGKTFGRKPVLKFAEKLGCASRTGRFVPGSFTNMSLRGSIEPRLVLVSDPVFDRQAIDEAARINCPTVAFCNTDSNLRLVDVAVPVNNRSPRAIGVSFFILYKLIDYIKNGTDLEENMKEVELFFYRDTVELEALYQEYLADNKIEFGETNFNEGGEFGRSLVTDVGDRRSE